MNFILVHLINQYNLLLVSFSLLFFLVTGIILVNKLLKMAAVIQNQIRQLEQKFKPYLYEGPLASYWSLLEQKTKVKREQAALGISLFFIPSYNYLLYN
jgi:hypothetical protein